ncbi:hypothetical protein SmJEL517_g03699 [Synchytrium microbalum]|uniref:Peptidyl-tRNA hydrolase n=1 Tax=Synchytrium microbalum TaxID=1806994 RepID=A0A507C5F6_9FUNG|nr:uncharacterized protein SmJEL517_g03699 [Synchytrium microbalum]TPX33334.1 hypothetical protein SmJEL517_g03699 [Synchytrium microbalum]
MALPVEYIILGLGNIDPDYKYTRHNAGSIFINYLANAIAMTSNPAGAADGSYPKPVFVRRTDLSADIHDITFNLSATSSIRVVLAKPLTGMNDSGLAAQKLLVHYGMTDLAVVAKKLIVVFDDINQLPGSIAVQDGGDLKSVQGHKGVESIATAINTNNFIRFRIGIGRPTAPVTVVNYVLTQFTKENKEMDLLGYSLQQLVEALRHLADTRDLKSTKKKYANSLKLPKNLPTMAGLEFPVETHGF